jgi:chaperonin cofactor prefoldin
LGLYDRIKELEGKLRTLKEDSNFHAAYLEGQIEKLQKEYDELKVN